PEVPLQVRLEDRRHEPARCAIDVDRNVEALLVLELVEGGRDLLHWLVAAVKGRAEDRDHPDRVLITLSDRLLGLQMEALTLHRDQARLYVPVAAELLPAHLDV